MYWPITLHSELAQIGSGLALHCCANAHAYLCRSMTCGLLAPASQTCNHTCQLLKQYVPTRLEPFSCHCVKSQADRFAPARMLTIQCTAGSKLTVTGAIHNVEFKLSVSSDSTARRGVATSRSIASADRRPYFALEFSSPPRLIAPAH